MDRYIVQNNVTGQQMSDQVQQKPTQTFIIQEAGTSKIIEATDCEADYNVHDVRCKMDQDDQYAAKTIDTSQFNEGVGNTTYIIDNNSSNSIDSVRIGNQSFVPVVDSSQLYNLSVAGAPGQYTIEGVVNQQLGNYIIEGPTYIVQTKPSQDQQQHMFISQEIPQLHPITVNPVDEKKSKKTPKKQKEPEEGPFICPVCNAEFSTSASLRFHSYHHNPKARRFSCIGCERGFEKDREKEEHELVCDINYTNNKFNCLFCDLPFSTPKNLRVHENKHRPAKKTKKYKHMCVCIKCNKAFDAIYTLKVHIKKIHHGNAGPDKKKERKVKVKEEAADSHADVKSFDDVKMNHALPDQSEGEGQFLVLS